MSCFKFSFEMYITLVMISGVKFTSFKMSGVQLLPSRVRFGIFKNSIWSADSINSFKWFSRIVHVFQERWCLPEEVVFSRTIMFSERSHVSRRCHVFRRGHISQESSLSCFLWEIMFFMRSFVFQQKQCFSRKVLFSRGDHDLQKWS